MSRYRLTPRAAQELVEILDYVSERNPVAATALLERIESTFILVSEMPQIGRRSVRAGLREFPVKRAPYLVIYEPFDGYVAILSVFHTSRDPLKK